MKNLIIALLVLWGAASPDGKKEDAGTKDAPKTTAYEDFFKDKSYEVAEGMMTLYKMDGKLYMELPDSLMGRDFLLASTISETSDNLNSIVGSKPFSPLHLRFDKNSDKIRFLEIDKENISRHPGDNIDKALAKSNIAPVFKSFDIKVYNNDSTSFIIDATDLFCSDEEKLSPFDPYSAYTSGKGKRSVSFSSSNSYISGIKAFSDNVSVKSMMSYKFSITSSGKTLIKDKAFSALMTRSILLLDKEPARARITDSRMSVFPSAVVVYDSESVITKPVYVAHRWRLEPRDTAAFIRGELTEPVKPVVFYIDPEFPEKFRPYITEGVSQWNEAFETIGFKNAVKALDFPEDDPEFDPDNIKYSCVRYAPTPIENSMGPSWVDPRSGEIIAASVYIYHDVLKLLSKWLFAQTAQTDPRVRTVHIPDELLGEGLRYVVSHEVGHCLGFMHNMGGSSVVPVDSLRSPSYTQKYGTTESIMDYARFNYVAQPGDFEKGVALFPPRFGRYDLYALKWNYMPVFGAADMWEEYETTSQWIHEASSDPLYRYGKQQSTVIDPRSQNEDLGDDAVKASEYGVKNLRYILASLDSWVGEDDPDYSFRQTAFDAIKEQYLYYLSHVFATVGGINLYEKMEGDPVPMFRSVDAERQKAAFDFLLKQLDEIEWLDNRALMDGLGLLDLPSEDVREWLMKMLLSCPEKVELSAVKSEESKPFTPQECLDRLHDHIWSHGRQKADKNEMALQRLYLKYLGEGAGVKIENGTEKKSAYNEPALSYFVPQSKSAMSYDKLLETQKIVRRRAHRCTDRQTRLHYELLNRSIEKALK